MVAGGLVVVVGAIIAVVVTSGASGPGPPGSTTTAAASHRTGPTTTSGVVAGVAGAKLPKGAIPAVESGLEPWQLPSALSREVALPGPGQAVTVLGGLVSASASTAAVSSLSAPAGTPSAVGTLGTPGHDAAGAVLGGRDIVFGGGDQTSVATVEALTPGTAGTTAQVIGQLPRIRSDASAVVIGKTAYVVGGYDGSKGDPEVLATTTGRTFSTVASLPIAVRYPAVATLGHTIYAFGGQSIGGSGAPVTAIQAVDTVAHQARVVGHLPEALSGAAAVTVDGHLYLAGGDDASGHPVSTIWAYDPARHSLKPAGMLQVGVSNAGAAVVGDTAWIIGGEVNGAPTAWAQMIRPNVAFGTAGAAGAGSPYFGSKLLIADRGNNRMLLLDDTSKIIWSYPSATMPPPPGPKGFYFPDDAFFIRKGSAIISNQEENETIVEIAYPSGKVLWTYGHPAQAGSSPGFLSEPDDAYLLKNGQITVADADNCRVLVLNSAGTVASQIGTTGNCVHQPPTSMTSPNGDTPLADGNLLISEITGSWVDEYTPTGQLVWSTHVAVGYPSDPQQLGPDLYLMANYEDPGGIVEFNRTGTITYSYQPASGPGMLDQPSLVERLPNGAFMVNDDYRDRMAAIDPVTGALIWQYGVADHPGTDPGYLNIPDGFDILSPDGTTPTHPQTG
jgi:hypothetical protein